MRIARFAAWLFLAAIGMALAPQAALAHGGVDHHAVAAGHGTNAPASQPVFASHVWSPACPGGSDHVCACGNLVACDGSTKPPALHASIVIAAAIPMVRRAVCLPAGLARPVSPEARSHPPRAPPVAA